MQEEERAGSASAGELGSGPRLPLELILHVISCLLPDDKDALLPASHEVTKTLLAFTLVCHGTHSVASRYLRQNCLYMESGPRLYDLLLCLGHSPARLQCSHLLTPSHPPGPRTPAPGLQNLTSIYLGPFTDDGSYALETARCVRELFLGVRTTLRRLVIDMPRRWGVSDEDLVEIRARLREGFSALTRLEEFVSLRDDLYLSELEQGVVEREVWSSWPALRRLALLEQDLAPEVGFWPALAHMPRLEKTVLSHPVNLDGENIKAEFFAAASAAAGGAETGSFSHRDDPVTVTLLNFPSSHPNFESCATRWRSADPEDRMRIQLADVPVVLTYRKDGQVVSRGWVRENALRGTLWDDDVLMTRPALS